MPKLLIFAPCERLILSQDNITSLVSVIEALNVDLTENIPAEALTPLQWDILSMWHRKPEDEGKKFEQRVDIVNPNGEALGTGIAVFEFVGAQRNIRNIARMATFPIGVAGEYLLKLYFREADQDDGWHEIAEYPILVTHKPTGTSSSAAPYL